MSKRGLLLVGFIAYAVVASLSAVALWTLWADGSWQPEDSQIRYAIRANAGIVAAETLLAIVLWRFLRHGQISD